MPLSNSWRGSSGVAPGGSAGGVARDQAPPNRRRSPSSITPRTPVKYCPFPPGGGRLGWGGRARDGHYEPRLALPPPLPSPVKGEGVYPTLIKEYTHGITPPC